MKGTIRSASLAALLAVLLCSASFAAELVDGTRLASDGTQRWDRDSHEQPPAIEIGTSGHPELPPTPPTPTPGESPATRAAENEGSVLTGVTLGTPNEKSPVSWLDPPDVDVEPSTWGLVKDLFVE
jgi:hypothetical protein